MTSEELCERIKALPIGGVETITEAQFHKTFGHKGSIEAMKDAAAALTERCECGVLFTGTEAVFATFRRKQSRAAVRNAGRRT